ncbi:MAG: transposase [Dehalococcoidia bacterium]
MMKYDPDRHHRRSIRLREYDYSQEGAYFITACTQKHDLLLDNIEIRSMIQKWWDVLPEKFPDVRTDQVVIMPNHIHGIIFIEHLGQSHGIGQSHRIAPTLGRIVQWFKTMTTNEYIKAARTNNAEPFPVKLWQRNYYEHILRNETDLNSARQYILDNPAKWEEDEDNPRNLAQEMK